MHINFLVNNIQGGWEPTDTRLGGTEESIVQWSEELVRRGYKVQVFRNGYDGLLHRGVDYFARDKYIFSPFVGEHLTINIKSSEVAPKEPTLYLTNETNANDLDLSAYKGVIWPSQWAKDNILVNNIHKFILPHGYDPKKIYPGKKISKQCFYASSPDRGLDILLGAWPSVHRAHPDATLLLTYGSHAHLPGVINLGECDEETMNEIYRMSDVWCHPANGGELYCMTGVKAQAAGCVPVIIPTMALKETVKFPIKATKENYAQKLTEVLDNPSLRKEIRDLEIDTKYPTWKDSTDKLLEIINSVVK